MPDFARVALILAKYAPLGMVPLVIPSVLTDVPIPVDRIPVHKGKDYGYVKALAAEAGYAVVSGRRAAKLKNGKGVVLEVRGRQVGDKINKAIERIATKQQAAPEAMKQAQAEAVQDLQKAGIKVDT